MSNKDTSILESLAWNKTLEQAWSECEACTADTTPGRIISVARDYYYALSSLGELLCTLSGKMVNSGSPPPVTGDWVALKPHEGRDAGVIEAVLPRQTLLRRSAAGRRTEEQALAANVDLVFIVSGADADFNPRRIERFLTVAWDSGAIPVVVLNKCDLLEDPTERLDALEQVAIGAQVLAVSASTGAGLEQLREHMSAGKTAVLIGSSGTGKSTITNGLLGREARQTRSTRSGDDKGRHVSVDRRLELLPTGGCLIDTPGLREIGLWSDAGIEESFADIHTLSRECRFNDCTHYHEPGCAVKEAVERGEIDPARIESYRKQLRELEFTENRKAAKQRKEEWEKGIAQQIREWRRDNKI